MKPYPRMLTRLVAAALALAGAGALPAVEPPTTRYTYVHHPVSTTSPDAQFAFDRGLTMIFAYQSQEAEEAFRQAARLDPDLAMAWWGIGLALGPDINEQPDKAKTVKAADALARAKVLSARLSTEAERDYIAALETRYTDAEKPDFDRLATAYRDAMRALVQKRPDDPDARALFAEAIMDLHPWRLWNATGDPDPGTKELVDDIETGFRSHPDHLGLTHFYIHAVEASSNPERALSAARRLAALPMEPAAAHLVHMPAHIYMRVGDWQAAVEANEHATHHALDYKVSNNPKAERACGHCADFLSYAYMMQGNEAHARLAAANYQKMTDDPTNTIAVLVRFGEWGDALAFPDPGPNLKTDAHDVHAESGFWHFARGMAYAGTHRIEQSQTELNALRAEIPLAPKVADFTGPPDVEHVLDKLSQTVDADDLQIAASILAARIAEARQHRGDALALLRKAVKLQDEIPYSEPPPWFYPIRESLGALLLRAGSATESAAVFRECLRRSPNNPRALLGLSAALGAQGRKAEAAQAREQFEAAWQHSDRPVTLKDL